MGFKDGFKTGMNTVKNYGTTVTQAGKGMKVSPMFKSGIALGVGLTGIAKATGWANNRINSTLQSLYPENMLPTSQGRFGKRTDGLSQSPTQGVKFNFRRK